MVQDLGGPCQVVLEASRTWGVIFDLVEEIAEIEAVKLAHPQKVLAIVEANNKTDKIDAGTLAQLLRADLIPAVYIPRKDTVVQGNGSARVFLIRTRTRLKSNPCSFGSAPYSFALGN